MPQHGIIAVAIIYLPLPISVCRLWRTVLCLQHLVRFVSGSFENATCYLRLFFARGGLVCLIGRAAFGQNSTWLEYYDHVHVGGRGGRCVHWRWQVKLSG